MGFYRKTQNLALTCCHFGISRQTLYRIKRYEPLHLTTVEERSHCAHRRRRQTFSLRKKVLTLRLQFPRRGFDQATIGALEMDKLNHELGQREKIYSPVRPHQSLG